MCGIIGFVGQVQEGQWGQTHDLLRALYVAVESRGRDATGFVARTEPLDHPQTRRMVVAKAPLAASRFVGHNSAFRVLAHRRCTALVGHVRAATHGDPKAPNNINNHPFVSQNGELYLVHNGIINNYREMAEEHALDLHGDCDSEVLLRLVETYRHPGYGLRQCLREVRGSMAVAMYDALRNSVWLARDDGRPLWLARLRKDNRIFFASTEGILLDAFEKVIGPHTLQRLDLLMEIPPNTPVVLTEWGRILSSPPF